jgi:molybdate transport system substrate-binding protein
MSNPIRLMSTLGVLSLVQEIAPQFEAAHAARVASAFDPSATLLQRLGAGEAADAVILTGEAIDALLASGTLRAGSRVDLARSVVGVAVARGAARPDISTTEAFVQTLLDAPSIAYSRAGASGQYFAGLIARLGIAEAVNAKATIIPAGFTAERVARGEVALAIQQVSELMAVKGVDIVGPLPAELDATVMFAGGVLAGAANPAGAASLLAFLAGAFTAALLRQNGLEPA